VIALRSLSEKPILMNTCLLQEQLIVSGSNKTILFDVWLIKNQMDQRSRW
jgi:hypothetical protein